MVTAILDASLNVIALGTVPKTIEEAQQTIQSAAVVINNAPSGLVAMSSVSGTWHKKGIQDGSQLDHYTEEIDNPEYVSCLKLQRYADIDARTEEIILDGFTHASFLFSLSVKAQLKWCVLRHYAGSFPKVISKADHSTHSLADAAARDAFIASFDAAIDAALTSGQDIVDLIAVETTVAAIDAITDDR